MWSMTVKCCIVQMAPGIYAKNCNDSMGYRSCYININMCVCNEKQKN